MSWTWEQGTGNVYTASGNLLATGYSGQPPHTNVPADEGLEGLGPLPCGNYKMVSLEASTPRHGPDVIVLQPDEATRARIIALGRNPDSFRLHGERLKPPPGYASDGCGILGHPWRMTMWNSPDHDLQVVESYDPPVAWP